MWWRDFADILPFFVISQIVVIIGAYYCRKHSGAFNGSRAEGKVPMPSAAGLPLRPGEVFFIAGFCLFYGLLAFWNLGELKAPVTEHAVAAGESVVIDFGEDLGIQTISWYLKDSRNVRVTLETRNTEQEPWQNAQEICMERVFCWGSDSVNSSGRYFRLTNVSEDAAVAELVFQTEDGAICRPQNASSLKALFDETALLPQVMDYRNGSYFDETYYMRTAYEFLNGKKAYEVTHPPLGKIFIALGAALFGTAPFGFRFMGALFGVLMLPFVYFLGRGIARSRLLGGFACVLFAFDFMHFTQTRIATIDVFITFFVIVMFFFMYRYSRMSFFDVPLWRTFLPLGACGVAFGLGIACKWTGFYAGAGLAILFFRTLYLRYREYAYALQRPEGNSNGISHAHIIGCFRNHSVKTLVFCVVFFVVVPFLIYLLSYLPFSDGTDSGLFVRMWNNQKYMLRYHTGLTADHAYASAWYQWPVMLRPVFYYSKIVNETIRQGISAFGNPLVWWAGIPAFFYVGALAVKKHDENAGFLCTAYLANYLPWCLVTRCTFAYHYFPSVPFVACMIMYCFARPPRDIKPKRKAALVIVYGALAVLLFVMFYPVISGSPVSAEYVSRFLRWRDTWVLVQ